MRAATRPLAVLILLSVAAASQAWIDTGHMIVAEIAYNNLEPKVKMECDLLLKVDTTARAYDFVTSGPWADDIRSQRQKTGTWHFIDYHFRTDGKPEANKPDAENVVWAIGKFSAILKDKSKTAAERSEALRFLIHFVGDVHQPLHATSRDSDQHPDGDKGGNSFRIEPPSAFDDDARPPRNLHSLWDYGCGLFKGFERPLSDADRFKIAKDANDYAKLLPEKSMAGAHDLNPEHWAQESLSLDKTFVYALPEGSKPTDAYIAKGEDICRRQITLAGYRLANLLNDLLK